MNYNETKTYHRWRTTTLVRQDLGQDTRCCFIPGDVLCGLEDTCMKKETWVSIFEFIIVLAIIVGVLVLVLNQWGSAYSRQQLETFDHCCNGTECSDVYWNGMTCVNTMGQDTNFIPFIFNWRMVIVAVGVGLVWLVLVLIIEFMVPKDLYSSGGCSGDETTIKRVAS